MSVVHKRGEGKYGSPFCGQFGFGLARARAWRDVTCQKCLRKRPVSRWRRILGSSR